MRSFLYSSDFAVSSILSCAWSVMQKNLIVFLGIVLLNVTVMAVFDRIAKTYAPSFALLPLGGRVVLLIVIFLIVALAYALIGSLTANIVFELLQDEWCSVMISLKRCANGILSAFLGSVIYLLVLLILQIAPLLSFILGIPAIIIMFRQLTNWFVFIPVCIVEKVGPIESLSRSSELVNECFWKVFFVVLFTIGVPKVLEFIMEKIAIKDVVLYYLLYIPIMSIPLILISILPAITYFKLMTTQEG